MLEIEAAFERTPAGIVFLHPENVAEGHDKFCWIRVTWRVNEMYHGDRTNGMTWDWDGDIDSVEWRTWSGDPLSSDGRKPKERNAVWWRELIGTTRDAALTYIHANHEYELNESGDRHAERVYYGELAA